MTTKKLPQSWIGASGGLPPLPRSTVSENSGSISKRLWRLLGHRDITTMRYAHFAPKHRLELSSRQRPEAESLRQLANGFDQLQ